jgi:DNA polymerase
MKVEVLGCGYGAGPAKVQIIARLQAGLELSMAESERIVYGFRKRPYIPGLWTYLENLMKVSAGGDFEMELPSGRTMRYRDVRAFGSLSAVIVKFGNFMRLRWWGGSLTENITQATARDVFMYHMLKLKKAGIPQLLRSHDEAVTLFDQSDAKEGFAEMQKIMSTAPEWMPDLPVSCDGGLFPYYKKP